MHRPFRVSCGLAMVAIVLAACASTPTKGPDAISTFAAAAATTPAAVRNAFVVVNHTHVLAQQASQMNKFVSYATLPEVTDFTDERSIALRVVVFDSLAAYAALLVDIAGGGQAADVDSATDAIAANLSAINGAGAAPSETTSALATALNGVGQALTNSKRVKGIAGVTQAVDPAIQAICGLMKHDIDVLLDQLHWDEKTVLAERLAFYRINLPREQPALDMVQRRAEMESVFQIVHEVRASRAMLIAMKAMLDDLASAHQALATLYGKSALPQQKAQAFLTQATRLGADHATLK